MTKSVIFNFTGVLADPTHRLDLIKKADVPNWTKFYDRLIDDEPIGIGMDLIEKNFNDNNYSVIATGIERTHTPLLQFWLNRHLPVRMANTPESYGIIMRKPGQYSPSWVMKYAFLNGLKPIDKAYDDNPVDCLMYKVAGIPEVQLIKDGKLGELPIDIKPNDWKSLFDYINDPNK